MLDAIRSAAVTAFHDACLARPDWPADEAPARARLPSGPLADAWSWVLVNHRCNCSLWDEEDLARRTRAADAEIAAGSHAGHPSVVVDSDFIVVVSDQRTS